MYNIRTLICHLISISTYIFYFVTRTKCFCKIKKLWGDRAGNHHIHKHKQSHKQYFLSKMRKRHLQQKCRHLLKLRRLHLTQMLLFFLTLCSSPPKHNICTSVCSHDLCHGFWHATYCIYFCKSEGNISLRQTPELLLWQIPQRLQTKMEFYNYTSCFNSGCWTKQHVRRPGKNGRNGLMEMRHRLKALALI